VSDEPGGAVPSVVLVDDSQEVRGLVRRLLQASGFDVVAEGGDGDEAILLAHHHQPTLLLLDASMPTADGIEALPAILALSPETKVVMFTGFEEPELAARARQLGATDFVEKSIPLEDLPARLMQIVQQRIPVARAGLYGDEGVQTATGTPEQATLSQHVQQFRELFDRAEIGMATLTSSGTVVRANRALAGLMSCEPVELVGVDYGRLTLGQGDDLDRRLEDIATLGADLASFEHYLPAPPDEAPSRIVRVTLAPIRDSHRRVLYVFAQVQDVTSQRAVEGDLRRSEENFRRLVNAVAEYAIFMLDRDGRVVSWNAGAQRIKGYAAHEIVGRHYRVFYPPEDQAAGHPEHNLQRALIEGGFAEEGSRVRQDGSQFWASVVITPVYDDAGEHVGFAKVTRDQTQQRDHEEERQRFVDERIHVLAMTAHELRTPTAVIDGSAGALQASWSDLSTQERDELLVGVRTSADRLRRLAADLYTASRSDAETLPLREDHVSLADVLHSAAARSHAAGADVRIEVDSPAEVVFRGDAERLAQALDNLVDNAVRHGMPPLCLIGTANDVIRIRVTDAGPGVPAELESRLFERFASSGPSAGTGLGLYLVRDIARRHGGDASYQRPTDGRPSTFELTLPRRAD
jgi:PAS domain S-box-containing protein